MLARCNNPKNPAYKNYGGRGIAVCVGWNKSFLKFYEEMGARPLECSLDRIDNSGGYNKANCKWSTQSEQNRNKRNNRSITYEGVTKCLTDWATELGIKVTTLQKRLLLGWTIREAFGKQVRPLKKRVGWLTVTQKGEIGRRKAKGESSELLATEFSRSVGHINVVYRAYQLEVSLK